MRKYNELKIHRIKELLAQGYSRQGIMYQLAIAEGTLDMYMAEIYKQLGISNYDKYHSKRALAIIKIVKEQLTTPSDVVKNESLIL